MSLTLSSAALPVFRQMLGSLSAILTKAEGFINDRNIDADALLRARLYPDMLPLARQIQIACDFARGASSRLAGLVPAKFEDDAKSFGDLQSLITASLEVIGSVDAAAIDGREQRDIVLRPGTPKERHLIAQDYLLHYALPQFFFHITTAYDILRHNGVVIGKADYMGSY